MCNFEALEDIRIRIAKLAIHSGELRDRFNNVEEEFREGNLSTAALSELNSSIHLMETDVAAFEKIIEA